MQSIKGTICTVILALGFLLTPPVYHYAKGNLSAAPLPPEQKAEAVMVFSGSSDRIVQGYQLVSRGFASKLMITGNDYPDEVREPKVRKALKKVKKDKVYVDLKATNTIENAQNGAAWAIKNNVKSILLVTSERHMPRAYFELRRLLPENIEIYTQAIPGGHTKYSAIDSERGRLLCRLYETTTGADFCYKTRTLARNFGM